MMDDIQDRLKLISSRFDSGDITSASEHSIDLINELLEKDLQEKHAVFLSQAYEFLCKSYLFEGRYEELLDTASTGRSHVIDTNDDHGFSYYWKFNSFIAQALDFLGEDEKLGMFLVQIPGLLSVRTSQYDESHLHILNVKARYHDRTGELYTCVQLLEEIVLHYKHIYKSDDPWLLDVRKHLVQIYLQIPDISEAERAAQETLSTLSRETSPTGSATFLSLLSEAYLLQGSDAAARDAAKEAIQLLQKNSERMEEQPAVLCHLGRTYAHLKEDKAARYVFLKAIALEERRFGRDSLMLYFYLEPFGQFLIDQNEFEEAISILERAHKLAPDNEFLKESVMRALAECYDMISEGDKANALYSELEQFSIDQITHSKSPVETSFTPPVRDPSSSDEHSDPLDTSCQTVSVEDALAALNNLIGQTVIKNTIKKLFDLQEFQRIREEHGIQQDAALNIHTVFIGNPGTGKTTVARIYGSLLNAMGLLENGIVHEVDRADLIGEYIGMTAPKTRRAIQKARGGVLFIDEAYALTPETVGHDYGAEAIEVLLKEMTSPKCSIAIVAAGYPREMEHFLNKNPGLRSRFGQFFHFEDYNGDELFEIAEQYAANRSLTLSEEAAIYLKKKMVNAYRKRDDSFGNARFSCSVIDEAKMNLANRLIATPDRSTLTEDHLTIVNKEDFEPIFDNEISKKDVFSIDEELLEKNLAELNAFIGLETVKREITELVTLVRYNHEIGKDILNRFSLHVVFQGNPGTGKTTVARLLGSIYYALGLLETGNLIECSRETLVGKTWGSTAGLVHAVVDKAIGGVLFIDEAYTLKQSKDDTFGQEAIDSLLKRMEDDRGKFYIICAGYPDEMEGFLSQNPGLRSRFDRNILFEDYATDELFTIAISMMQENELRCNDTALSILLKALSEPPLSQHASEGNARMVRALCEQILKNQNLRLAQIPHPERTNSCIQEVIAADITKAVEDLSRIGSFPKRKKSNTLGFRHENK